MKQLTKQQVLDKTPENTQEQALQELLRIFSKTKLEQHRRMLNEIGVALYKSQLKQLPYIELLIAYNQAVALNQTEKNE